MNFVDDNKIRIDVFSNLKKKKQNFKISENNINDLFMDIKLEFYVTVIYWKYLDFCKKKYNEKNQQIKKE